MDYPKKKPSITSRSILIGLLLIPMNSYWVIQMEIVRYSGHPTCISLFFNVIFILSVLIFPSLVLRWLSASVRCVDTVEGVVEQTHRVQPSRTNPPVRFLQKIALNNGELLAIYVMLCIASAVSSHDIAQVLIPILSHAFWFATEENEWQKLFWNYIPSWLSVSKREALEGFYQGESSLYTIEHIKAWLCPALAWSLFTSALLFIMVCINIILRKQWIEREKLSYPIIQLPLEMIENQSCFFNARLMWIGFTIASGINILNGLHFLYPAIPSIPAKQQDIGYLFSDEPLNAIGWFPISFYPFVIGLGFLIPLDLSFSCWFFYLVYKAQLVFGSIVGFRSLSRFPYPNEQISGAFIGICIIALFGSRKHLKNLFMSAFGRSSRPVWRACDALTRRLPQITSLEYHESNGYRKAIISIVFGIIAVTVFCLKSGMSLGVTIGFFTIYFIIAISITRMRAQLGAPVHDLWSRGSTGPETMLVTAFGTRHIGAKNLTMFAFLYGYTRDYRSHPMPHQLESFKIAERIKLKDKSKLVLSIILASFFGALASFWAYLHSYYEVGSGGSFGWESFNRLQGWLYNPSQSDVTGVFFIGIGFAFSMFLMTMRARYLWWPFHPLGYALSASWTMNLIWLPLFLSWFTKVLLLKFGGLKAHRRAIPFFLGLILGEFVFGSIWTIIGIAARIPTYAFWI